MLIAVLSPVVWIEWEIASIENRMRAERLPVSRLELDNYRTRPDQSDESARQWRALDLQWQAAYSQLPHEDGQLLQRIEKLPEYGQHWDNLDRYETILSQLRPVLTSYQDQLDQPGQSWEQHSGQAHRGLYRAFICELRVSIHRGDSDRAFQAMNSLVGLVNAERGCAQVTGMLSWMAYLEGIRSELELALPRVNWNDSQFLEIQKRLCAINLHDELRFSQAECVIDDGEDISERAPWIFRRTNRLQMLRYIQAAQSLGALPWPQMQSELAEISDPIESRELATRWYAFPQKVFIEGFLSQKRLAEVIAINALKLIVMDVGLAVHRHQLRHGRLPQSWSEIDNDLLLGFPDHTSLQHDPRDGIPLQFIAEEDHVRLTPGAKSNFRQMPEFRIDRVGTKPSRNSGNSPD